MMGTQLRLIHRWVPRNDEQSTNRVSPISVVTHLSADRLPQLHGLCLALTTGNDEGSMEAGITLCVALLVDGDSVRISEVLQEIRAMPRVRDGDLRLRLECYAHGRRYLLRRRGSRRELWYPINQLRNKALALAETDLVLMCDVDFRPCKQLARFVGADLLEKVSRRLTCVVLPAFEVVVPKKEALFPVNDHMAPADSQSMVLHDCWWERTLASKAGLVEQWDQGRVTPFASNVWEQGHRATCFAHWREANEAYEATYEEGFEPFVIMNRLLVPAFDERFDGYGRNKVIFFYRLHALGFTFAVEPDLFLVHAPHPPSASWTRTFGREASPSSVGSSHSARFALILEQYEVAKAEIDAEEAHRRHSREGWSGERAVGLTTLRKPKPSLGCMKAEGAAALRQLRHAMRPPVCPEEVRGAFVSTLHALWYEYRPKRVNVELRLESQLRRNDTDITVVTQCSLSRLGRLERMCSLWTGILSVAVFPEGGGVVDARMRGLAERLHVRVEAAGVCRLDMFLCQADGESPPRHDMYPVNALRNVALGEAKTDLVLLLDIDTMPMRNLHDILSSRQRYKGLLGLCEGDGGEYEEDEAAYTAPSSAGTKCGAPTIVVIPALEFGDANDPHDPRIRRLLHAEDKQAAADLLAHGHLRAFHAEVYPEGHAQTNLDRWRSLRPAAPTFEIEYSRGYEPYGLLSRRRCPAFDERFMGFGMDKVSFFWHLHRLGWAFRALPSAFLLDLPHATTNHRRAYQSSPSFRAAVHGLFQRFATEVNRSVVQAGVGINATGVGRSNVRVFSAADVTLRDYEVLSHLSLLAWGDAWRNGPKGGEHRKSCGSGWDMKGGIDEWIALVDERNEEGAGCENYGIAIPTPSRAVGKWVRVRLGSQEKGGMRCLLARSALTTRPVNGVLRYWIHPRWEASKTERGKLLGMGMSGDIRFFVRWRSGNMGFCSLTRLGQPLKDVCQVHFVLVKTFLLESNSTISIQLQADARRKAETGGALAFRAWADGRMVFEARVYAADAVLGVEQARVNDVLFHVLAGEGTKRDTAYPAEQDVLIGGVEMWGEGDPPVRRTPEPDRAESAGRVTEQQCHAAVLRTRLVEPPPVCGDAGFEDEGLLGTKLRFVFVASTGRCGTHYLSRLLGTGSGVRAFHEAAPTLSGHRTLLSAARYPNASYGARRHKVDAILRSAQSFSAQKRPEPRGADIITYVDTSHLFIHTFADVVMRELAPRFRVDVIVLRRDPAAVLRSRIELSHFCGRTKISDWLLLPEGNEHRFSNRCGVSGEDGNSGAPEESADTHVCVSDSHGPRASSDMDGFEALIAWAAGTEASIRRFKSQYAKRCDGIEEVISHQPGGEHEHPRRPPPAPPRAEEPPVRGGPQHGPTCNVVEITLEALSKEAGVRRLFEDLELETTERTWDMLHSGATNTRDGEKRRVVPLEYCRERLNAVLASEESSKRMRSRTERGIF